MDSCLWIFLTTKLPYDKIMELFEAYENWYNHNIL